MAFASTEKTKKLIANVSVTLVSRLVNLGSTIIVVPLAVKGLGAADYGVFAIILSAIVIFAYSDLGMGLVVVNKIAAIKNPADQDEAVRVISNIWYFLIRVSVGMIGLGFLAMYLSRLLGIGTMGFVWQTWLMLVGCVAIGLAPGLTQRILFGLQRNVHANLWNTFGRVASVIGVYTAFCNEAPLYWYIFSAVGLPALVGWVSTLHLWRTFPELKPKSALFNWKTLRSYIPEGLQFMLLQLGLFFETGMDNALIGAMVGVNAVANYDLLARIFVYISALISMLAFPLWPAISHAKASGDTIWIKKILKISAVAIFAVSTGVAVVFAMWHAEIIRYWVGVNYEPNYGLATAFAVFSVLTCIGILQSMYMNGMGLVSMQVKVLAVSLTLLIPAKFFALMHFSQTAMVWVLVAFYATKLAILWFKTNKLWL